MNFPATIGARKGDFVMSLIYGLYENSLGAVDWILFDSPLARLLPDRPGVMSYYWLSKT